MKLQDYQEMMDKSVIGYDHHEGADTKNIQPKITVENAKSFLLIN